MQIIDKQIKDLKPYEKNPRKNDEAVKYVAESIKQFGFKVPIIIDKDNIIIAGHTRYKAAKQLKIETVPCIIADDLTEEQIKAFRIADNKVAEFAEWDLDLLNAELENIMDIDMLDFGFETEEAETEVEEDNFDVDEAIESIEEPKTKLGEIYLLGKHRLIVGDSTQKEDVLRLMDNQEADLLLTDPPYNVAVENSQGMKIENDNMNDNDFREFLNKAMENASAALKKGGAFYIWHGDSETINFRTACINNQLTIRQCLIWVKNGFNFGRQDYKWKHEPCLYGWKEGASHYFIDEYNIPTVIEDKLDLNKLKKEEMKKLLEEMLDEKVPTTVIHEDKPIKNTDHPTMKPINLLARQIKNSSKQNEIVLDLFGGSGSTLIACEQLGRICYMVEYDPKYADVIINRWETFTGEKAIKIC